MDADSQNKKGSDEWYLSTALFDSVRDWKWQSAEIQVAIESRLGELKRELPAESETAVWEALAPSINVEWKEARTELERAAKKLNRLHSEDKPLGLIGQALEGERVNRAEEKYNMALATFTMLDESLRQKDDVRAQLDTAVHELRHRMHLIEEMEKTSQQLQKVNELLDDVLSAKPAELAEMPTLPEITPQPTAGLSDESLLEQARHMAKSALDAVETLPDTFRKSRNGPSLTSLFATFAKRSIASLRKPYSMAASKPFK